MALYELPSRPDKFPLITLSPFNTLDIYLNELLAMMSFSHVPKNTGRLMTIFGEPFPKLKAKHDQLETTVYALVNYYNMADLLPGHQSAWRHRARFWFHLRRHQVWVWKIHWGRNQAWSLHLGVLWAEVTHRMCPRVEEGPYG